MKYSKEITYTRKDGKEISYTRTYNKKNYRLRTVKRKNKKTGKVYSYTYKEYKTSGKVFRRRAETIMKDGKLTEYGEEWIEEYKKGLDISDLNDLEDKMRRFKNNGEILTVDKLKSILKDKVERYIYNIGGEPDDVANDLGVDRDVLFNEKNWNFKEGTFKYVDAVSGLSYVYAFTFNYDDHIIKWNLKGTEKI